ncbi:MAG: hypothetical protein HFE90_06960 [Firmicutes bacterium]|nr:hypothetical protein [Bacillota bacterium]
MTKNELYELINETRIEHSPRILETIENYFKEEISDSSNITELCGTTISAAIATAIDESVSIVFDTLIKLGIIATDN